MMEPYVGRVRYDAGFWSCWCESIEEAKTRIENFVSDLPRNTTFQTLEIRLAPSFELIIFGTGVAGKVLWVKGERK